jgi:hypothetical protein
MSMSGRRWRVISGLTAGVLIVGGFAVQQAEAGEPAEKSTNWRSLRLSIELRQAIRNQSFEEVLDKAPPGTAAAARIAAIQDDRYERTTGQQRFTAQAAAAAAKIHQTPNVDATVIELDSRGRTLAAANVLLSPQYPDGKVVPLDRNLATDKVRWRKWDDAGWDTNHGQGTVDAVPGRENAPIDFMSPYPASVLKLMVGYGILRLVDQGVITLDEQYAYDRTGAPNTACGLNVTKPIRQFFDEMQTVSRNESTCALIKLLHQKGAMNALNQHFQDIGLPMLQLIGTRTVDGGGWGQTQMNALDTAKLLLIVNGGPGTLWRAPDGTRVTKDLLSDSSREFYLKTLEEQGLNQVLSTTNWCGRAYPAKGIPQRTAERWINPADGTMTVAHRVYGQDVRPCNESAEVRYLHKTGLVDTSGNDAGIVHNLPGKAGRHYIVAVHANLGDRYTDPNRPADPPGIFPVAYTEKYATLGLAIDKLVTRHRNG